MSHTPLKPDPAAPPPASAAVTTRMTRAVEWGECDPAGIIFYPTYYHWMDAASWHLFAQAGYSAARVRAEHLGMPLVHAECSFVRSPAFGDICVIESAMERLGSKSFTVRHRFLRADDGVELAHGRETRVWCRYSAGPGTPLRGEAIPDAIRALLTGPHPPGSATA